MATKKEDVNNDLYDVSELPSTESNGPARIEKAGITHNLKVRLEMTSGDYKNEEAKAKAVDGKWHAFSVTVSDDAGLELTELYFMPPQKADDVMYPPKKFEMVEGKMVETRDCTQQEALKILNNEFFAYLRDLGEALGFKTDEITQHLMKNATGFIALGQAFVDRFKPSETTRISAKILWNNQKKKERSDLKIHGPYVSYYPYGNDFFDLYKENRPTLLKLSNWEMQNGMNAKFTNSADAPSSDAGNIVSSGGQKPSIAATDDDPF